MPDPGHATEPRGRVLTALATIAWPALPNPSGAGLLAAQHQLRQSEWWDADVLRAHQFRQLGALLRHARNTSPFYETRLAALDLDDDLTAEAFSSLPTLSREEVQEEFEALRCRVVPPDHGRIGHHASSGSTGRPVRVLGTEVNQFWWQALVLRDHLWHRRDFGARLGVIKTKIDTGTAQSWGPPADLVFETGPSVALKSQADIADQARWLLAEEPDYLLSHASGLRALARYCLAENLRPRHLREVRSFGEMLPPDLRELAREAWGVPVTDAYSAQEIGVMALQCPEHEHYHVQSEHLLLEVLNEAGTACAPGETGRVVVTPLHNFAMPLVRYELYDYAEVGAPCPCGRGLPVLTRIMGRRRNMLHLPDGSTHWPSFPASVWDWASPIRQFQLVQETLTNITIRLVAERPLTTAEAEALYRRLDERLGWSFEYRVEYVDRIEGGPSFEDFRSRVDERV